MKLPADASAPEDPIRRHVPRKYDSRCPVSSKGRQFPEKATTPLEGMRNLSRSSGLVSPTACFHTGWKGTEGPNSTLEAAVASPAVAEHMNEVRPHVRKEADVDPRGSRTR